MAPAGLFFICGLCLEPITTSFPQVCFQYFRSPLRSASTVESTLLRSFLKSHSISARGFRALFRVMTHILIYFLSLCIFCFFCFLLLMFPLPFRNAVLFLDQQFGSYSSSFRGHRRNACALNTQRPHAYLTRVLETWVI